MALNMKAVFDELNIPYQTNSSHATTGWLQFKCSYPECDDTKDHLGYNIKKEYFHCWKCGWHPLVETVALLARKSKWEVAQIIDAYRTGRPSAIVKEAERIRPKNIVFPFGTDHLMSHHLYYLSRRGFPKSYIKTLIPKYNILATSPVGFYKLRILFPITHYGKLVSYQCRDFTGKAKSKYLACSSEDEIFPHKDTLFGADIVKGKKVVITEGIFDALKLGPGAVAVYGVVKGSKHKNSPPISWAQTKQLVDRWKQRYIFFDSDTAGQDAAKKLAATLSSCSGKTYIVSLKDTHDPGSMPFIYARQFMKRLKIKV